MTGHADTILAIRNLGRWPTRRTLDIHVGQGWWSPRCHSCWRWEGKEWRAPVHCQSLLQGWHTPRQGWASPQRLVICRVVKVDVLIISIRCAHSLGWQRELGPRMFTLKKIRHDWTCWRYLRNTKSFAMLNIKMNKATVNIRKCTSIPVIESIHYLVYHSSSWCSSNYPYGCQSTRGERILHWSRWPFIVAPSWQTFTV